jgi:transcriptional regulator with XRE-family HTH domain
MATRPVPGTIGERVRAKRRALGLTQVKLAEKAGMGQSNISSIESGDNHWTRGPNLLRLAAALEVSAKWLATGLGDPQQPVGASTDEAVVLDILRSLSAPHRAAWIATGHALVAADLAVTPSKSNPFPIKKATARSS